MNLQTPVHIPHSTFEINPTDKILFVGSCFADSIGKRLKANQFCTTVNPYGVMYNPASILHTVKRSIKDGIIDDKGVDLAIFTLGTNHIYVLNETGEIVDNCQKRPQRLFTEKEMEVEECTRYLSETVDILRQLNVETKIVLTVSPIRYAKYGFHGSQLSKATLLLVTQKLTEKEQYGNISYFPAYEIMNDELRDYRFYHQDMLHPSEQAVDYIFERFQNTYFSQNAIHFVEEWKPIEKALQHRPFNSDSNEYKAFLNKARNAEEQFRKKWINIP